MLTGVGGRLVSEELLEERLTQSPVEITPELRRSLAEWRIRASALGPASTPLAVLQTSAAPLLSILALANPANVEWNDAYAASTLKGSSVSVVLLVTPWAERLDGFRRAAIVEAGRRSARWAVLCNGTHLRLVDASRSHSHRFLEFDLAAALDDPRSLAALRLAGGGSVLAEDDGGSLRSLVAASDAHAIGVCRSLREGVLAASADVLGALLAKRPAASIDDSFEQALTIVYRILFLLFAEARALVPVWHPVYRTSYSIESLCEAAERPQRVAGLWDALRAIARLAHSGCVAGDLRVTPFNGRLFAPGRTPLAERRHLDDEAARRAILSLATRGDSDREGRRRIAYRDLGVEQLGAVYETVLDYEPRVTSESARSRPRMARRVTLVGGSGVRKTTGTFYTPQAIAEHLVRSTLAPLVRDATASRILSLRIVDPAMGSGAFLVAACRYLASEYEQALIREGACHAGDVAQSDRAGMRRTVAERCLYGVDVNPMAVQLARLSLWLATMAGDRPLSFLDHRLQAGDSLVGAWLAHLSRHPAPPGSRSDGRLPLFSDEEVGGALRDAVPLRFSLEETPNDTLAQVHAKERMLMAMAARGTRLSRWKRVANAWCASWFDPRALRPGLFSALVDFALTGTSALPDHVANPLLETADALARGRRFFHWELEFPEVFFGGDGRRVDRPGFDAVIGNPPWEMLRADTGDANARPAARRNLAPLVRFVRESGVYATRRGHPNRYQLFVERAIDLTKPGGRIGLVLPSGLATDGGSAELRRKLLTRCDVDSISGVDNHRGVFPIHRSVRFLLLNATSGAATQSISCRFGLSDPADLERSSDDGPPSSAVQITPALVERISGPDLVIPAFRSATDVAIVERAATLFPSLGSGEGWRASFGRELNATDDRDVLRVRLGTTRMLPVLEGKHIDPFRARTRDAAQWISEADARERLPHAPFDRPRLSYRDVASATNRRTLIAALLPAGCVSTHTLFCLRTPLPHRAQLLLCGFFNSFVVNYLVRLRVTTHVTTATVERLPIPLPEAAPRACRQIAALARLLARRDDAEAKATLNASIARLYQLDEREFRHVLDTFPLVAVEERERALAAMKRLPFL